jgi:hypothetical protein
VNRNIVSRYDDLAEYERDPNAISRPDQFERKTALAPRAALTIIVLASFGLWWAIWLAVSSLASLVLSAFS